MHVVEDMVGKQGESNVGVGVGLRGERGCASKFLVAVARQHHPRTHTPPPSKEDIQG